MAPPTMVTSSSPLDGQHALTHQLGLLLDRWSFLEAELTTTFSCLLDGNDLAASTVLYSINSTTQKVGMVAALTEAVLPAGPEKEGLIYVLDRIRRLALTRNDYVHGEYWQQGNDLALRLIRPQAKERHTYRKVTVKEIAAHIEQVERRTFQLMLINEPEPEFYKSRHLTRA